MHEGEKYHTENFGVCGVTLLEKGHNPFVERPEYSRAMSYKPNVVVINLGTNDVRIDGSLYTHTHTHARTHTHTHTYMYIYTHTYIYTYIYIYIFVYLLSYLLYCYYYYLECSYYAPIRKTQGN